MWDKNLLDQPDAPELTAAPLALKDLIVVPAPAATAASAAGLPRSIP